MNQVAKKKMSKPRIIFATILYSILGLYFLYYACNRWVISDEIRAKDTATKLLSEKLKAPSEAEYISKEIVLNKGKEYLVHIVVDAPNSYGVKIRNSFLVFCRIMNRNLGEYNFEYDKENGIQPVSNPPTSIEIEIMKRLVSWDENEKEKKSESEPTTKIDKPEPVSTSNNKPIVNNYNVNKVFDAASEFVNNKNYDSAIATYRIIDSMLYQFPLNDTCVSFRAIAVANLSWLYFLTNIYEPSLAYAKTFDEIIAHQNILFADSIMNGHKNQTLYNKIWSNVALGNLKEAIKLTGNKGRLGMDDEKVAEGFKLTQIRQNSPAWNNHLKIGDILTSFNDIPLNNISDDSLVNIINASPRGTRVNISIIRDNIKQTGFITMGIIDSSYATSISK